MKFNNFLELILFDSEFPDKVTSKLIFGLKKEKREYLFGFYGCLLIALRVRTPIIAITIIIAIAAATMYVIKSVVVATFD